MENFEWSWILVGWRGKVSVQHTEQELGTQLPVSTYPTVKLGFRRLGFGTHALPGAGTVDCSGKGERGCVGHRTTEGVLCR